MVSHEDLINALDESDISKRLVITPLLDRAAQVGPGSIDLRLGTELLIPQLHKSPTADPYAESTEEPFVAPFGTEFAIQPGQFLLGATFEFVGMPPHLMGQVLNRSSWARQGLMVATAVTVQPGYGGCLTLELINMGQMPLPLRSGSRIAQLVVWRFAAPTQSPYGEAGKYVAPLGPQPSRLETETPEQQRLRHISDRLPSRSRRVAVPEESK